MTYKLIVYSIHARQRMTKRAVSRADVRAILATGEALPDVIGQGGTIYHERVLRLGSWDIGVVYIEDARRILIVTVERLGEKKETS